MRSVVADGTAADGSADGEQGVIVDTPASATVGTGRAGDDAERCRELRGGQLGGVGRRGEAHRGPSVRRAGEASMRGVHSSLIGRT
jgi:hypothetical protein